MNLKQQECANLKCSNRIANDRYILYHHPNGDQSLFFCKQCFPEQIAFMTKQGYKFEVVK
jgi:hypothetical protein